VHTGKRLLTCFNLHRQIRLSLVIALGRAQEPKLPYRTIQDHTTSSEWTSGDFCLLPKEANIICYNAALRACERAMEWARVLYLVEQLQAGKAFVQFRSI